MSDLIDVVIPDIGDFEDVEVIEILVAPGDAVGADDSLISIESDKATLEVPSPRAGVVRELAVSLGDRVSAGSVVLRLEVDAATAPAPPGPIPAAGPAPAREPATLASRGAATAVAAAAAPVPVRDRGKSDHDVDIAVIGGGPGGYTAAFRAADLGKRVVLVERYEALGGVCLNVGCIPSKALLHVAEVVNDTRDMARHGVAFGEPTIDLVALGKFRDASIRRMARGLAGLAKQRGVIVLRGTARFSEPHQLVVESDAGVVSVGFDAAIVAVGSRPMELDGAPVGDPRLLDSTGALQLDRIPGRLLVVGGGIIGLEMATVYDALGSAVTVVEFTDTLMPGCDRDLVKPLARRIARRYENIYLGTRVAAIEAESAGLRVGFEGAAAPASERFDAVLVAVGRRPNGDRIDAEKAGLSVCDRGFLAVDAQQRTSVPHIFAIGDVVGQPMLAHKATHQGRVAAEVIAGLPAAFDARGIPSVAYTDPEVAWVGLTEDEATERGVAFEKGAFPWSASGRAQTMGRSDGVTKVLVDPESRRLLGVGMVGRHAGELVAEGVHALEMGADAEDIALTIHPHPTLSETLGFAAEMVEGTITDLMPPGRDS